MSKFEKKYFKFLIKWLKLFLMGCTFCKKITKYNNSISLNESQNSDQSQRFPIEKWIPTYQGSLFLVDYLIIKKLGEGSFGFVREVQHISTGIHRAAKTISIRGLIKEQIKKLLEEVNILKNLDHPGIIKIFQVYLESTAIHIITELCEGGELIEKIISNKSLSENTVAKYLFDIVSAMKYCHDVGIIHRDLKPENILFEDMSENSRLKIVDFGTSVKFKKNEKLTKITGTPYYIAPEVICGEYNEKCDIWSIGIIMYIMLTGIPPFQGKTNQKIFERIISTEPSFKGELWKIISPCATALLKKLLRKDPKRRISIGDLFFDPWIRTRSAELVPDKLLAAKLTMNLTTFKNNNKLKTCAYAFLSHFVTVSGDLKIIRGLFQELDKNGDGRLSKQELLFGLKEYCSDKQIDIDEIISSCDINK